MLAPQVNKDLRKSLIELRLGVSVTVLPGQNTPGIQDGLRRLQCSVVVQSLDFSRLSRNMHGDRVRFEDLASAVKLCNGLQRMNLRCMCMSERGILQLGELRKTLTKLCELNLASNGFDDSNAAKLCEALQGLPLTSLDLRDNSIREDGCTKLSQCFAQWSTLEGLHLENNRIGEEGLKRIASALFKGNPNLRSLNLKRVFTQAPSAAAFALMGQLVALEEINISSNKIGAEGFAAIARAFASLSCLRLLDLSNNELGPGSAAKLRDILQACPKLCNLCLRRNNFGDAGVAGIGASWDSHGQLACLDMGSNNLSAQGLANITAFGNFTELNLSHNRVRQAEEVEMLQNCFQNVTVLRRLSLQDCGLSPQKMVTLMGQVPDFGALTCLELGGNHVWGESIESLAKVLGLCTTLCTLGLDRVMCGPGGMLHIANHLVQLTRLTHVNLAENRIGTGGSEHLARVLRACTRLCKLDISKNNFDGTVTLPFFGVLLKLTELKELDVSFNELRVGGIRQLMPLLAQSSSLSSLNLEMCHIGDEGVQVLAQGLRLFCALRTLDLSSNLITTPGTVAFALQLSSFSSLTRLFFACNASYIEAHFAILNNAPMWLELTI